MPEDWLVTQWAKDERQADHQKNDAADVIKPSGHRGKRLWTSRALLFDRSGVISCKVKLNQCNNDKNNTENVLSRQ